MKRKKSETVRELVEFRSLAEQLKKILRARKMTYRELAEKVGISESGLKKIILGQDCSFNRLSRISSALGFRITDLLNELDEEELRSVRFSEAQQAYFLKNIKTFGFFVKLAIERQPVETIKKTLRLSDAEAFSHLKKLDDLGLIQLLPKGKIKLPPLSLVKDFGAGPLLEHIYQKWGSSIVRELASPINQTSGQFIVRCLQMKNETYQELLSRLLDLESEFLRRAVREMTISPTAVKTARWMWMTDQESFVRGKL